MAFRFRSLLVTSLPLLLLGGMAVFLLKVPDVPPPGTPAAKAGQDDWLEMDLTRAAAVDQIPGWDVRRGSWALVQREGKQLLELKPEPIVEGKVFSTRQMRGSAGVRARLRGERSRRTWPRFSVGLHQDRELHLRAFPGERKLELVACDPDLSNENLLLSVPVADWPGKPEDWCWLEFTITPEADGRSRCEGRIWQDGQARPDPAQLEHRLNLPAGVFLAALQGAPFALKPILVDAAAVRVPPKAVP